MTGLIDKEVNKNVIIDNFQYPPFTNILRLYDKNFVLRDSLETTRYGNYEGSDISYSSYNTENNLIFWYGIDIKKDTDYTKAKLYKIDIKKLKFVLIKEKILSKNKSDADLDLKSALKLSGWGEEFNPQDTTLRPMPFGNTTPK